MTGADLLCNIIDELERAQDLLKEDEAGALTDKDVLRGDIEEDLERIYDNSCSLLVLLEDLAIEC